VESIQRDYEELRARMSAEFAEIVGSSPDGLGSFLRQLALIQREMRTDLTAILSPEELEDFDFHESAAGRVVRELLGDTGATEEQQRAVFRLQREYEDRFALTFDETPAAMFQREQARQQTQSKIRDELGDAAFATWLSGEGSGFGQIRAFTAKHNLPAQSAFELWRSKNDYDLARLEILAQPGISLAQARAAHEEVLRQAYARISAVLGANAHNLPHSVDLDWLVHP
jgi:hypothetical protein